MLLVLFICLVTVTLDMSLVESDDVTFVMVDGIPVAATVLLLEAVDALSPVVTGSVLDGVRVALMLRVDDGLTVVEFVVVAAGMPVENVVPLLVIDVELLGMLIVKFPGAIVEFIIVAPGIAAESVIVVLKPVGIVTLPESVAVAFMLSCNTVVLLLSDVGAAAVEFASTVVLSVALRGPLMRLLVVLEEE